MSRIPESDPCLSCSIRNMRDEGCCTQNVGYGTKTIENKRTGARVRVCSYLTVDDGRPFCGQYLERNANGMCAGFSCERKRRYDAGS